MRQEKNLELLLQTVDLTAGGVQRFLRHRAQFGITAGLVEQFECVVLLLYRGGIAAICRDDRCQLFLLAQQLCGAGGIAVQIGGGEQCLQFVKAVCQPLEFF